MSIAIQQGVSVPLGRGSEGMPKGPELASAQAASRQASVAGTSQGLAGQAAQTLSGAYGVASQRQAHEANHTYDAKRRLSRQERGRGEAPTSMRRSGADRITETPGYAVDVET